MTRLLRPEGTRATQAVIALGALLGLVACTPAAVVRDGVRVPYEQAAEADLRSARDAVEAGRLADARATLERSLEELPDSRRADQALFLLGDVYLQLGDPERAALAWRRLLRRHPRSRRAPETSLRVAEVYRDLGRPEVGRRILEEAPVGRASAPLRARMHRLLADLARASGDYPEAVRALALARRDTDDAEQLFEIDLEIQELLQERLRDRELRAVVERLPRGPVYDRALLELARRELGRGEFEGALEALERLPQRLRPVDERQRQLLLERAQSGAETGIYSVGLAVPLTGPYASFGESVLRGMILGLRVFDDPPGSYRVVVRDTGGDPARAVPVVDELVGEGVRAIVGPMRSVVAAAAAPRAERAGIPLLTLAPSDDLAGLGEYVFRLGLTPSDQAPRLVRHAMGPGGARRFAILYPRDRYGVAFKNLFWDEVEQLGGTIVGVEGYAPDAVDLQSEIKKLVGLYYLDHEERELLAERDRLLKRPAENAERLADPELTELPPYVDFDALFIPDVAERVGLILPQLRFYDVRGVLLLGPIDWNDPRLVEIAGRDARGAIFLGAFHAQSEEPAIRDFVGRFYAAFGREPDLSAAEGYDAAALIGTLVEGVPPPGSSQLRRELLDLRDFSGVSGLTGFDEHGAARRDLKLLQIRRNEIRLLDTER